MYMLQGNKWTLYHVRVLSRTSSPLMIDESESPELGYMRLILEFAYQGAY
jgi:hypothetical protein